ncbi:hypothetical protein RDI58_007886 [Solanum bulbocastanum]|uniref:Uncharacterized protein n=1 Tax=Solanum bulbocastanum TaxID=147425 RepID=A0AAN8TTP5_SOLBU
MGKAVNCSTFKEIPPNPDERIERRLLQACCFGVVVDAISVIFCRGRAHVRKMNVGMGSGVIFACCSVAAARFLLAGRRSGAVGSSGMREKEEETMWGSFGC